jgi:hypothetical protein
MWQCDSTTASGSAAQAASTQDTARSNQLRRHALAGVVHAVVEVAELRCVVQEQLGVGPLAADVDDVGHAELHELHELDQPVGAVAGIEVTAHGELRCDEREVGVPGLWQGGHRAAPRARLSADSVTLLADSSQGADRGS